MDINCIMVLGSSLLLISALIICHIPCWKEYIKACRLIKVGKEYKRSSNSRFRLFQSPNMFRVIDIEINSLMKVIIILEQGGIRDDRIVVSFDYFLENFDPVE